MSQPNDHPWQSTEFGKPSSMPGMELPEFKRLEGKPFERLMRSKQIIGDQYWAYLGMCLVGLLIGSLLPFGILMGPVMCGLYVAYRERMLGRRMTFDHLIKGADYFGESLIATLVISVCVMIVILPIYLLSFGLLFFALAMVGGEGESAMLFVLIPGIIVMQFILMLVTTVLYVPFVYVYPLIVDRKLNGLDAVKTSWAAARRNFLPIWWFMIGNVFSNLLATLACWLPAIFLLPLNFAATFELYRETFGVVDEAVQQKQPETYVRP